MIRINPKPEQPKYPVYCAWCGRKIGLSAVENSHGMCKVCSRRKLTEWRLKDSDWS